jgi:hypothetical protein
MPIDEILNELPEVVKFTEDENKILLVRECRNLGYFIGILSCRFDEKDIWKHVALPVKRNHTIIKAVPFEYLTKKGDDFIKYMTSEQNCFNRESKEQATAIRDVLQCSNYSYFFSEKHTESSNYHLCFREPFSKETELSEFIHKRSPFDGLILPVVKVDAQISDKEIEYYNANR